MALSFSQGVVNNLAQGLGWGSIIKGSTCVVYTGTKPSAGAEVGSTGSTELVRFTIGSGALTSEKRAACKVTVSADAGTVTSIKVGGLEILNTSVTTGTNASTNAALLVAAINANNTNPDYYATLGGVYNTVTYATGAGVFYIVAPKNSGTFYNGATAVAMAGTASTTTLAFNNGAASATASGYFADATLTGSYVGVAAGNALEMTYPAVGGVISKKGTWSGTATGAGTQTGGWFRLLCTPAYDDGTSTITSTGDDAYLLMRIDGTIGTSGADMIVSSPSITNGVSQTVSTFTLTIPTA